jgi:hypothetical protein
MIHLLCWLAVPVFAGQGHTELRVEAIEAPDRRVELLAELARARASLADQRETLKSVPDGQERNKFLLGLKAFEVEVAHLESAIAAAPTAAPSPPARAAPSAHLHPVVVESSPGVKPSSSEFNAWVALGLGAIAGLLAGLLFSIGRLPAIESVQGPRAAHLVSMAMLLMAVGPALVRMNFDQTGVVIGWILLSCAALLRFAQRRFGSQLEAILLEASTARARGGGEG